MKQVYTGTALAAAVSLVSGTALAQQQAAGGIEEITVTAQKREEKLNRVPISISALSEAHLERAGAKDIEGFAREVPGLSVQPATNGGAPSIVIRGISSAAGDATVGIYIDDTPIQALKSSFSADPTPKLFDIQRVEVLRGPQGTLYGASSEGGTIRFLTPVPSLTEFSAKLRSELAFTKDGDPSFEIGAAAGGPLVQDKVGFRGSVWLRRDGGYVDRVSRTTGNVIDSDVNRNDAVSARLAFNLATSDRLQILPSVYYQRLESDGLPLTYSNQGKLRQADNVATPGSDRFVLPSLTVNYDFDAARVTSVTSYFDRRNVQRFDYSLITMDSLFGRAVLPGFENYQSVSRTATTQKNFTQELRIASAPGNGRFSYTLGAFYQHAKTGFGQTVAEPQLETVAQTLFGAPLAAVAGIGLLPGGLSYLQNSHTVQEQLAGFGEVGYELTDRLKLAGGIRVAHLKAKNQFAADGLYNGGPTTPDLLGVQKSSETPVNPKITLSYQLTDTDLIYATASRGFRTGGPNTPVPASRCAADLKAQNTSIAELNQFKSDSVWSYELGAKSQLLDNRLSLNGSIFQIDWKDIQQPLSLPGCGFGYVANLGKATSRGFDLSVQYRLFAGLTLGANVAYTRATLDDDIRGGVNAATGLRPLIARKGDFTLLVPTWTYNLVAQYDREIASGYDGFLRADLQHSGSFRRTTSAGTVGYDPAIFRGPSYNFLTLRAGITHGGVNVSAFINNALDAQPVLFSTYAQNPGSRQIAQQATIRPRTIGVNASYQF